MNQTSNFTDEGMPKVIEKGTQTLFTELYDELKPKLPRCRRINKRAFNMATEESQKDCLLWLKAIKQAHFDPLQKCINWLPPDQWEHRRKHMPNCEEYKKRKQLESELRLIWERTMPELLRK